MPLKLNEQALKRDLFVAYHILVQQFVDKLAAEARASKPAPPGKDIPEIKITKDDANIIGWTIVGKVMAEGGWAVISEFGSGSEMELDNPALQSYIESGLWNPLRPKTPGAPITGRPRGWYVGLFGRRYSKGSAAGRNIEGRKFKPVKGTAWFRAIFKLNMIIFARQCVQVLREFPIYKYIDDGRR